MPIHTMFYIKQNENIPEGMVTSTARKGDKWFDKAKPGDLLELRVYDDGGRWDYLIGMGVVTKVERVSHVECLHRAKENHVCQLPLPEGKRAFEVLEQALLAAYGPSEPHEPFTMVHCPGSGPGRLLYAPRPWSSRL